MSTLAKVFVVINLVLAIAFCFTTLTLYAKRTNFKAKWEDERKAKADMEAKFTDQVKKLDADLNTVTNDRNLKAQTAKDLSSTVKQQEVQIKEGKDDLLKEKELNAAAEVELSKARQELDNRHNQINDMHKIIQNQARALTVAKENEQQARRTMIDMENQLNAKIQQYKDLAKEKAKVERELANQNYVIQTLEKFGIPVPEIVFGDATQPVGADLEKPIHAKVLAVDNNVNLVMLSVGEDNGVKPGHQFTVYRSDEYIGRIQVERTFRDMCSARILPETMPQGKAIKEGDNAATRVY